MAVEGSAARRRAFRVAVGLPLFMLVVGAWQINVVPVVAWLPADVADGLPGSMLGDATSSFGIHRIHYLALAAAHLAVIASLLLQLRRPRDHEAPMWQASVGLALVMALTWPLVDVTAIPLFVPIILLSVIAAGALHPSAPLLRLPPPGDPLMVTAAGLLAVPLLLFGSGQLRIQVLGGAGDPHWVALHYNFMTEYAIQLVVAAWAGASTMTGWRWSVGIGATMAALLGVGFTVHPDQASSRGPMWGMLLVGWALLWVVLARRRHRLETRAPAEPVTTEALPA